MEGGVGTGVRCLYFDVSGTLQAEPQQQQWPEIIARAEGLLWVDLQSGGTEAESTLTDIFHFHPLAVEDALGQQHVPRVDDWQDYLYTVFSSLSIDRQTWEVDTHEIDVFLGRNYIVTHQAIPVEAVEQVWQAMVRGAKPARVTPDHLLYRLQNEVCNGFFQVLDLLDEDIDCVQDEVFQSPASSTLSRLFSHKRALLEARRLITPTRELLNRLARDDYSQISSREQVYFRDLYDQMVRLVDMNESLRDLVAGALDAYLSVVSNRLNEVMKRLTVLAVLALPLNFLTGFFGMNFFASGYEVRAPLGGQMLLAASCALMVLTPLALALWLRRKGWF